jgi:hypothetical protein
MISDMATLAVEGSDLVLGLSLIERVAALRPGVRVPLSSVLAVEVTDDPYGRLHGIRAPGTGIPGLVAYGVWRLTGARPDFVALAGRRPAIVVSLGPAARFERLIVSLPDPEPVASAIRAVITLRPAPGAPPA